MKKPAPKASGTNPTQKTVAQAAGVSQVTVSQILSGKLAHRYHPETYQKVLDAARKLNYHPNRSAQTMRSGRSNLIVYLNFGGYSEIAAKRTYHIGRLVHEAGFDYQAIDAYWWIGDPQRIIDQIIGLRPEALLIGGTLQFSFANQVERLFRAGIPVVTLGSQLPGLPSVNHDPKEPARIFTEQSLLHGRRFIASVGYDNTNTPVSRHALRKVEGFQEALVAAGACPPEKVSDLSKMPAPGPGAIRSMVISMPAHGPTFDPFQRGMDIMKAFSQWPVLPDALICRNDHIAIGALTVCQRLGIKVPDDMVISGTDNLAYGTQGLVSLTTAEPPLEAICTAAMGVLLKRIGQKPEFESEPESLVFLPQIFWRESLPLLSPVPGGAGTESPAQAE